MPQRSADFDSTIWASGVPTKPILEITLASLLIGICFYFHSCFIPDYALDAVFDNVIRRGGLILCLRDYFFYNNITYSGVKTAQSIEFVGQFNQYPHLLERSFFSNA